MYLSRGDRIALVLIGVLVSVPTAAVAVALIASRVMPSNVRRALPASATGIQEYKGDNPFVKEPDTTLYLKAKMPESEMPGLAAKLNLEQRYFSGAYPSISFFGKPSWWNNSLPREGAYVSVRLGRSRVEYAIAQYEGGYVYVKSTY